MQVDPKTLIEHVRLDINPKFTHWVLFSNGTYIIIEDLTIKDEAAFAKKIMKEYGPVHIGSPAGDFGVTHLNRTEGWALSGHYSAMYTYVDPEELKQAGVKTPSDIDIGVLGRNKRDKDGKECKFIFNKQVAHHSLLSKLLQSHSCLNIKNNPTTTKIPPRIRINKMYCFGDNRRWATSVFFQIHRL